MPTYSQTYYQKNKEKIKAKTREYQKSNPIYVAWQNCKHRALRKGHEFTIQLCDIVIPEVCPILDIPLDRRDLDHSPSVDRVDNTQGYTPGNIRVISNKANTLKGDLTPELCMKLFKYMTT